MPRLLEDDDRAVVRLLNYKAVGEVNPYRPMGPNTLNEYLWPVWKSDTQIGFSYIGVDE